MDGFLRGYEPDAPADEDLPSVWLSSVKISITRECGSRLSSPPEVRLLSGLCVRWIGHDASVAMSATDFLDALAREVPETKSVVDEHLEDNDGVLQHLLTADLRRFAIECLDAGQRDVLDRLLALVDVALREGTDDVQNAIAVSFVEDTGWWDPAMHPFIEAWPEGLRAEIDRQRHQPQ